MSDIALNALVRKRAEMAGELERHELAVRQLRIDLDHLNGTIRLFDIAKVAAGLRLVAALIKSA